MLTLKCYSCATVLYHGDMESFDLTQTVQQLGECPKCHAKLSTTPKQILINGKELTFKNTPKVELKQKNWWTQEAEK